MEKEVNKYFRTEVILQNPKTGFLLNKEMIVSTQTLHHTGYSNDDIKQLIENKDIVLLKDSEIDPSKIIYGTQIHVENKIQNTVNQFIQEYYDYRHLAELFHKIQPYFFDRNQIWWMWNRQEYRYEIVDETDIMNYIDTAIKRKENTMKSRVKSEILEAMKRVGRLNIPKDQKKKWIQFKNKAVSIFSGKEHTVTHHYFFTNPIPWDIGESSDTPVMDRLIKDWVGEKYLQTVYEIFAYCCYSDYPIQVMFCFYGSGRNGKSCLLRMIDKFIAQSNVCTTELDLIAGNTKSRFELFKLYKKLVCIMGETNFSSLDNTSILKKLTGADKIGFEKKRSDPFDDYSYAKLIIASNSLPSSNDTSEGFYRRWLIIPFTNEFPEGKDILEEIPEVEYNNLARKVCEILPGLLSRGSFTNQGSIVERRNMYISVSNPLPLFLDQCCDKKPYSYIRYGELHTAYVHYLNMNKRRKVSAKEFKDALESEGFWIEKTSKKINDGFESNRWIDGIQLKGDWKAICDNYDIYTKNPTLSLSIEGKLENKAQMSQTSQIKEEKVIDTHHHCIGCGLKFSHGTDNRGRPVCEMCGTDPNWKSGYTKN